jgi:hypothetical protein
VTAGRYVCTTGLYDVTGEYAVTALEVTEGV